VDEKLKVVDRPAIGVVKFLGVKIESEKYNVADNEDNPDTSKPRQYRGFREEKYISPQDMSQ
jgi:hypothetical protein